MAYLYPNLYENFKSKGMCPICLTETTYVSKYICSNNHMICYRCRPYYYSCPQCLQALTEVPPENQELCNPAPTMHLITHSPSDLSQMYTPSAPNIEEFHDHERHNNWNELSPTEEQKLLQCPYAHLGCTAKFISALREMHISRCLYKGSEEEHLPRSNDLEHIPCIYQSVGCNVQTSRWRLRNHEQICIYKSKKISPLTTCIETDLAERIPCRYRSVGCNVRVPQWKLHCHEEICIYKDKASKLISRTQLGDSDRVPCRYQSEGCEVQLSSWKLDEHENICIYKGEVSRPVVKSLSEHLTKSCSLSDCQDPNTMVNCCYHRRGCMVRTPAWRKAKHEIKCNYAETIPLATDPEQQVECRWTKYGCRVQPKYERKYIHEENCNYKMEECPGCRDLFHPSRRYIHEKSCSYA